MSKIISLIKSCWRKILCAFCAFVVFLISLVSGICVSASSVAFQDLVSEIVALTPAQTVVEYASVISDLYLYFFEDGVMSDREIARLNIQAAWKTFTDNSSFTADEFSDYWDNCINDLGITDDRLILIEETVRLGFTKEQIIAYCYESDGDGISVSSTGDVQVTGSSFKRNVVSPWADYYKPMPTTTQYIFSYQTESFSSSSPYDFPRFAPIYMNTNGSWGKKNWSSVYILTFLKDDDITYYSNNYFHIYASKDSGSLQFYKDSYSLSTGKLVKSYGGTSWDIDDYPFLGFVCKSGKSNSSTVMIGKWPSYHDYLANTNGIGYMNYFDIGDMISVNNSLSTLSLSNMRSATSFSPDSNLNDDWGFILSADPFELFSYQTSIDFEKIPDNYTIIINGDTIYDYSITNPDTGDTSTINEYVTNNYTYITNNNGDDSGSGGGSGSASSGGSVSGDVNVGGNVDVSGAVVVGGQIDIKSDPIDINVNTQPIDINVNVSSGGNSGGSYTGEAVDISGYLDNLPEQSETMNDYFSVFFSFVPPEFLALLISGISIAILMRVLGR